MIPVSMGSSEDSLYSRTLINGVDGISFYYMDDYGCKMKTIPTSIATIMYTDDPRYVGVDRYVTTSHRENIFGWVFDEYPKKPSEKETYVIKAMKGQFSNQFGA